MAERDRAYSRASRRTDRKRERAQRKLRRRMERRIERDRRRLRRSERELSESFGGPDPAGASAEAPREDPVYREATRRANLKTSVAVHSILYAMTLVLLLRVAGFRVMVLVALAWGIGLAVHYALVFVLPQLRNRWVHEEVGRQVEQGVSHHRRYAETRRTRSLEDLSASIAHEIRNPIAAAKSLVQQMGEDPISDRNIDYADVALAELDRVERSISHLLRFAREEELRSEPLELEDVAVSAVENLLERLRASGIALESEADSTGPVTGDPEQLRRVVINLLANAIEALERSAVGEPRIQLAIGESLSGAEVWLRIRDNGPGIPAEYLDRIFDPFYTGKEDGNGIGLAVCRKIVESHDGQLEVGTAPGEGSEFVVTLPRRHGRAAAEVSR